MADKSKILVVDDEPSVHEILTEFFTSKGYEVISASGGLEGLSKTEKHRPDVILLDVRMPDLDGITQGEAHGEISGGMKFEPLTS